MPDLRRTAAMVRGFLQPTPQLSREEEGGKFIEALSGYGKGLGEVGINIAQAPLVAGAAGLRMIGRKPTPGMAQTGMALETLRGRMREAVPTTPEARIGEFAGRTAATAPIWLTGAKAIEAPLAQKVAGAEALGKWAKPLAWATRKAAATPLIQPILEEGGVRERVQGIPGAVAGDLALSLLFESTGNLLKRAIPYLEEEAGFAQIPGPTSEYGGHEELIKKSYKKTGAGQREVLKPLFEQIEAIERSPTKEGLSWLGRMKQLVPSRFVSEFNTVIRLVEDKLAKTAGGAAPEGINVGQLFTELGQAGVKGTERQAAIREALGR